MLSQILFLTICDKLKAEDDWDISVLFLYVTISTYHTFTHVTKKKPIYVVVMLVGRTKSQVSIGSRPSSLYFY